jgi:hypothetical protein
MALEPALYPSTLDRSAYQYVENYDMFWEAMKLPGGRLRFLDLVKDGPPVDAREYYWTEDIAKVRTVSLNGAITNETTWTLQDGEAAYLQLGDMLHTTAAGIDEWVQVNATPNTTNHTISVTRNVNGLGIDSWPDDTVLRIVRTRNEGSGADSWEFKGTVRRTNYTVIISHTVGITGTAAEGQPRANYGDELDRQEAEILLSLKGEVEDVLLFGPGQVPAATPAYGAPQGIRHTILARNGGNIGTSACQWGFRLLNDRVKEVVEEGFINAGSNLICLVPIEGYAAAGFWGAGAVTREASDRTFGFEVNMVHTTVGIDVPLIWAEAARPDEFMLIDMGKFERNPFKNRTLIRMTKIGGVGNTDDFDERRLLMEFGCKLRYADKAHYLQKSVNFSY